MLLRTVRHARQFVTRRAPLFPGYLFVWLELGRHRWRSVNGTRGVRGLLTAGDLPARVPPAVIEELQAVEAARTELPKGAFIEMAAGPLTGLVGRLSQLDGAARVIVLLQLAGAERAVSVDKASVRRVG